MATAKLMASPNSDLKRRSSSSSAKSSLSDLEIHRQNSINTATASTSLSLSTAPPAPERRRSAEEVWKEIVAGRMEKCKEEMMEAEERGGGEMMTLEDFLAKAEVKVEMERMVSGSGSGVLGFGMEEIGRGGKRKGVTGFEVDKAAQQRQRRMIKNRESAARSRERKQAYQVELESMAMKLEEENELLLKEKGERTKERFKQLMEKVVPVVEKRRPQRVLKRVRSAHW